MSSFNTSSSKSCTGLNEIRLALQPSALWVVPETISTKSFRPLFYSFHFDSIQKIKKSAANKRNIKYLDKIDIDIKPTMGLRFLQRLLKNLKICRKFYIDNHTKSRKPEIMLYRQNQP